MSLLFGEVLYQGLTPAERLWMGIHALEIVAEVLQETTPSLDHVIGVSYTDNRGNIQATFEYCYADKLYLPCYERHIQNEKIDMRERHVLEADEVTTASTLRNGDHIHGGAEQIVTMARGVETMVNKIVSEPVQTYWWVVPRARAE